MRQYLYLEAGHLLRDYLILLENQRRVGHPKHPPAPLFPVDVEYTIKKKDV